MDNNADTPGSGSGNSFGKTAHDTIKNARQRGKLPMGASFS